MRVTILSGGVGGARFTLGVLAAEPAAAVTVVANVGDDPPADAVASYVEKYRDRMARNGWSPADFARDYSVPLRIEPTRLRGW